MLVKEVDFLRKVGGEEESENGKRDDVGRIDMVLVHPQLDSLAWCALEMQAVYFSGDSMKKEFEQAASFSGPSSIPFPVGRRRPDYRSSGPKRLMPQLQIKVPTLRRWGVKTAVIIDKGFFSALGPMQCVDDLSNGDIMWFVVDYEKKSPYEAVLKPAFTRYTTLEHAVEGLTAGVPISKNEFEIRIRQKLLGSRSRQSK